MGKVDVFTKSMNFKENIPENISTVRVYTISLPSILKVNQWF
jgi:hypothetical protein